MNDELLSKLSFALKIPALQETAAREKARIDPEHYRDSGEVKHQLIEGLCEPERKATRYGVRDE